MRIILIDLINSFFIKNHGINQELFALLESYPHKKILTTNATDEYLEELGIRTMPYDVFSLERNPSKTEKAYYERLAEKY